MAPTAPSSGRGGFPFSANFQQTFSLISFSFQLAPP